MPLSEEQFKNILDDYEHTRTRNISRARERKAELYAKIPPLRELDEKIADISLSAAKKYIDGSDNAFDYLAADIACKNNQSIFKINRSAFRIS